VIQELGFGFISLQLRAEGRTARNQNKRKKKKNQDMTEKGTHLHGGSHQIVFDGEHFQRQVNILGNFKAVEIGCETGTRERRKARGKPKKKNKE
jgi:hypothetical protein